MRILYISTSYPKPNAGSTIYTDLAEALYNAGHEITVAVSEQPKVQKRTSMQKERNIDVLRIVTGNYYDIGLIEKGLTTIKMPYIMRRTIRKYLGEQAFDLILYEAPPVTNVSLVKWAKRRFHCRSFLMLKDIFPQNAVDLGMIKKGSLLHWWFKRQERTLYASADLIGCMSEANVRYVCEHNPQINREKIIIFPNAKKLTDDYDNLSGNVIRRKLGISDNSCVFLFGGNMGRPQCMGLLSDVIVQCKGNNGVFFLFVGRGTDKHIIEETIAKHDIKNALVVDNLPREDYEQIVKECDVGLVVLDPRFTIPNYPSRILSYMEYAKPVLAVTDAITDLRVLIEEAQCGEWVWAGDVKAVRRKVEEFALNSRKRRIQGINARKYIDENIKISLDVFEYLR